MAEAKADYDARASGYDRRYGLHAYAGIERALIEFIGPDTSAVVLEVGCGTGHWLQVLAGRSRLISGVDPSAQMLARARAAMPAASLHRAAAEDLPVGCGTVDRVFCVQRRKTLRLVRDCQQAKVFTNCRRCRANSESPIAASPITTSEMKRSYSARRFTHHSRVSS